MEVDQMLGRPAPLSRARPASVVVRDDASHPVIPWVLLRHLNTNRTMSGVYLSL